MNALYLMRNSDSDASLLIAFTHADSLASRVFQRVWLNLTHTLTARGMQLERKIAQFLQGV